MVKYAAARIDSERIQAANMTMLPLARKSPTLADRGFSSRKRL